MRIASRRVPLQVLGSLACVAIAVGCSAAACGASTLFFVFSDDNLRSLFFSLTADAVNGGPGLLVGSHQVQAYFDEPSADGPTLLSPAAMVYVSAADPPPFDTCTETIGAWLGAGAITITLDVSQDGFAIAGTLSTVYCSCDSCAH